MPQLLKADEAMAQIAGMNQRIIEQVPERARRMAQETCFYIYNVGPEMWQTSLGSLGRFTIRPCPEGKKHSEPLVIPGIVYEAVPRDNQHMTQRQEDGYEVAKDIVGIGPFKGKGQDLTQWGVFISENNPPTEAELVAARGALQKKYAQLVQEADNWYAQGPQFLQDIGYQHRRAARELNVEREWSKGVAQMTTCPGCGEIVKPGLILHGGRNGCGWVFDKQKYEAAVAAGNIVPAEPVAVTPAPIVPKPESGKPIYQQKR